MNRGQHKTTRTEKMKRRRYQQPQLPIPRYLTKNQRSEQLKKFVTDASTLILEIGCGVGLHPLRYAMKNPDHRIVAVERTKEKFEKFFRRYVNHDCPKNLFPVHADAEAVFNHYVADASLDQIYFLYPNPEPKNPSRRWIRMPFFEFILKKIKNDGNIIFVTNDKRYYSEILSVNAQEWKMSIVFEKEVSLNHCPDFQPRTHFEKKYLEAGQTIYEVCFVPGQQ